METSAALLLPGARLPLKRTRRPIRLGTILAIVLSGAGLSAIALVAAAGMTLETAGFLRFLLLAATMVGLASWCRYRKLDPRVGDGAMIVAAAIVALMACGIISNAGLRLGAAPIDALLVRSDAVAGIKVDLAVRSLAAHPLAIDILAWAYNVSGAVVVALIAWTLVVGSRYKTWELVTTIIVAMQVVALISIAAPAVGAMQHLGLLDLQGAGLPVGAGVYHLEAFDRFHAGSDPVLRLSDMTGLVTFPSFHTVLALMVTQALAETRWRWLGAAWTATVIVSTVPIGGHYASDLVTGAAIWAGCAWLSRRISTPSA